MKLSLIPILLLVAVGMFSGQLSYAVGTFDPITEVFDGGANQPQLWNYAVDGDNVYVLFLMVTSTYVMTSTDRGETWNTPVLVSSSSAINLGGDISVGSNGDVGAFWKTSSHEIASVKSTDSGATFSSEVLSSTITQGDSYHFSSDGDNLLVLYNDSNGEAIFEIHSNDLGATWEDEFELYGDGGNLLYDFANPFSLVHGMNLYSVWINADDNTGGLNNVYFAKSNDDGATWSTPFKLSPNEGIDAQNPETILYESGGEILVTYIGIDDGKVFVKSDDGGNTFGSELFADDLTHCNNNGQFASLGADLVFACSGEAIETGSVVFFKSTDFGDTFGGLINATGVIGLSEFINNEVTLKGVGDNFYTLNIDDGGGANEDEVAFLVYSEDRGDTWQVEIMGSLNATNLNEGLEIANRTVLSVVFEDIWIALNTAFDVNAINMIRGVIPNTGLAEPDTTAPVISTIFPEPITVIENSVFDFTDFIVCLDDTDGDISILMSIIGDTLDTTQRGLQDVTFSCTDVATNNSQETISFLVKKQSGSGGGGSSSSTSTSTVSSGTQSPTPSLSDIPTLSFSDRDSKMVESSEGGTSISDLFASLFSNRIDTQTGERPSEPLPEQATKPQLPKSFSPSSPTTSERPSPVTDFLNNLFASIFG